MPWFNSKKPFASHMRSSVWRRGYFSVFTNILPKFIFIIGLILFVFVFSNVSRNLIFGVNAVNVNSGLSVNNSAPSFTLSPFEVVASTTTSPTNVGSTLTFRATGTDPNSGNYYLAVCKTNSVTPVNGGAPTCGGGAWCVSSATASGTVVQCSRTAIAGDVETNSWYAFVCDGDSTAASCSSSNPGDGDNGSPFYVNHQPAFTVASATANVYPGENVTFTSTASDSDTTGTADTVKLVVCKTAGISGGACDGGAGDTWCSSSLVSSNPSCIYTVTVPTHDETYAAYVYVFDNHNLGASGSVQGSNRPYSVYNAYAVASNAVLNGGSDIVLTEGTTTNVPLTFTVTDSNGTGDVVVASTFGVVFLENVEGFPTVTEPNSSYVVTNSWTISNNNGLSMTLSSSVDIQYHASPTDADTPNQGHLWRAYVMPLDDDDDGISAWTPQVELLSLVGFDVTTSINYGNLNINQSNDPLGRITTITATGNVGLDEELSGSNMCTDYPTCSGGVITVDNQRHALAASTSYSSGTALSGSAIEYELNCQKTTVTASPATKNTWWGLYIPYETESGSYTGMNSIVAVKGEYASW